MAALGAALQHDSPIAGAVATGYVRRCHHNNQHQIATIQRGVYHQCTIVPVFCVAGCKQDPMRDAFHAMPFVAPCPLPMNSTACVVRSHTQSSCVSAEAWHQMQQARGSHSTSNGDIDTPGQVCCSSNPQLLLQLMPWPKLHLQHACTIAKTAMPNCCQICRTPQPEHTRLPHPPYAYKVKDDAGMATSCVCRSNMRLQQTRYHARYAKETTCSHISVLC